MILLRSIVLCLFFSAFAVTASGSEKSATPPPVSAETKAAVRELLDATNFKSNLKQMQMMMAQNLPNVLDQMLKNDPRIDTKRAEEAKQKFVESRVRVLAGFDAIYADPEVLGGLEGLMASAYAKHFSLDELRAVAAFYRTSAGKKSLSLSSTIVLETMPQFMALVGPRIEKLVAGFKTELTASAANSAEKSAPAK